MTTSQLEKSLVGDSPSFLFFLVVGMFFFFFFCMFFFPPALPSAMPKSNQIKVIIKNSPQQASSFEASFMFIAQTMQKCYAPMFSRVMGCKKNSTKWFTLT